MDSLSAVAQPADNNASTEQLAISIPKPRQSLADASTIEFAPGLRRPPSLGTPPPPPRPGDPLYQDRLGRAIADSAGRGWRVVVPVAFVGLLVATIGVGLAFLGGKPSTPVPTAAPRPLAEQIGTPAAVVAEPAASAAVPSATADPSASPSTRPTTRPAVTTAAAVDETATMPAPIPAPTPALAGPSTVPFGTSFSFAASGFTCAGAQLLVTLGGESIPAGSADGAGNANIVVNVGADGQVPRLGGDTFILAAGDWTLNASIPGTAGCTAVSASATITVT